MLNSLILDNKTRHPDAISTFLPLRENILAPRFEISTGRFDGGLKRASILSNDNQNEIVATSRAAKEMLSVFSMHLFEGVRIGLLKQTSVLLNLDEWDDEDVLPSLDSYRTMLRSLVEIRPLKRPNLGLSDRGNFLAAWKNDGATVIFEFLPTDRMVWTISQVDDTDCNRASGTTNVKEISAIIVTHHGRAPIDGA